MHRLLMCLHSEQLTVRNLRYMYYEILLELLHFIIGKSKFNVASAAKVEHNYDQYVIPVLDCLKSMHNYWRISR